MSRLTETEIMCRRSIKYYWAAYPKQKPVAKYQTGNNTEDTDPPTEYEYRREVRYAENE